MEETSPPTTTASIYRVSFNYLVEEVRKGLPADGTEIHTRRNIGLIAWGSADTLRFTRLLCYDSRTFRFSTDLSDLYILPKRLKTKEMLSSEYRRNVSRSELSFHISELAFIKGSDLVPFVESVFNNTPYDWPLFTQESNSYPEYAWSVKGRVEYDAAHAQWKSWRQASPSQRCSTDWEQEWPVVSAYFACR
jgi:hypothetical protein